MAIGDAVEILNNRLRRWMPRSWFGSSSPILTGLLTGMASAYATVYQMIAYAQLQTRIATATDGWLDLISWDFLGSRLPRKLNQSDDSYRTRINQEILRSRTTRPAMIKALTDLTGRVPTIFEPANAGDAFCLNHSGLGIGRLGSFAMPAQAFINVSRAINVGVPNIAGLGSNYAGLGCGYMALADSTQISASVTDGDIYAEIEAVRPAATIMWVSITD